MASTGTAARAPRHPQPARPDPNRAETARGCAQKRRLSPSYLGVPRWTGPGRNDTFANSRRQSRRCDCVGPGWGVLHIQRRITREGVGGPAQTRPSHGPSTYHRGRPRPVSSRLRQPNTGRITKHPPRPPGERPQPRAARADRRHNYTQPPPRRIWPPRRLPGRHPGRIGQTLGVSLAHLFGLDLLSSAIRSV